MTRRSIVYFLMLLLLESITWAGVHREPWYWDSPTFHPGTWLMIFSSWAWSFFSLIRYSRSASFWSRGASAYRSCRSKSFCSLLFLFPAPIREKPQKIATEVPRNSCQPLGPRRPLESSRGVYVWWNQSWRGQNWKTKMRHNGRYNQRLCCFLVALVSRTLAQPPAGPISWIGLKLASGLTLMMMNDFHYSSLSSRSKRRRTNSRMVCFAVKVVNCFKHSLQGWECLSFTSDSVSLIFFPHFSKDTEKRQRIMITRKWFSRWYFIVLFFLFLFCFN